MLLEQNTCVHKQLGAISMHECPAVGYADSMILFLYTVPSIKGDLRVNTYFLL